MHTKSLAVLKKQVCLLHPEAPAASFFYYFTGFPSEGAAAAAGSRS